VPLLSENHETQYETFGLAFAATYFVPDKLIIHTDIETCAGPPGSTGLGDLHFAAIHRTVTQVNFRPARHEYQRTMTTVMD